MNTTPTKPRTVREIIAVAAGWLAEQGVEEARVDTELLLAHVLGCRRLDLYMHPDKPVEEHELGPFRELMRRRGRREPVAYLVGEKGFYGLDLEVSPAVLIPRPETEHLVQAGLAELDRVAGRALGAARPTRFADVGTGSGCVALALAKERRSARGVALDRSSAAIAVAARNAVRCRLGDRVSFVRGDLLEAMAPGSLDLVVSNPPYVTPTEEELLAPDVLRFEPREALFDVAEDLPLTARLVRQARSVLRPGGALAVETGFDKAPRVERMMADAGFEALRREKDLAGIERVVVGRAP